MRTKTMTLLGLTTLLMGADGVELTIADLPSCATNSYLVYRGGKVVCEATLPDCTGQLLHADRGGNIAALSCIPKVQDSLSSTDRQRAMNLQTRAQGIFKKLDELGIDPSSKTSFIGMSKATTRGRIEYPGTPAGLPAANALCAAEFGYSSYMCSMPEMFSAVMNGALDPEHDIAPAWLYMPTWYTPVPAPEQPLAGLADNCGGYTDATDNHGWTGMAVEWSKAVSNIRVLKFHTGPTAACSMTLPIACCR